MTRFADGEVFVRLDENVRGADVFIVGLSSRTAITLVQLGIDLSHITTRATLAAGLVLAFARLGLAVVPQDGSRRRAVNLDGATS